MQIELHKANSRGHVKHGWLDSYHSFSFGTYYHPERMGFGYLRVLNDDVIDPASGFDTHPHANMEIISIPISGALIHKDNMGNAHVIRDGEVQVMSAGTGIAHSEYNYSNTEKANFLQIWILPKLQNIEPRYEQKVFAADAQNNRFQTIVSPEKDDQSLWINQDARLQLGNFKAGQKIEIKSFAAGYGMYVFVIDGQVEIIQEILEKRDAITVQDFDQFTMASKLDSRVLLIETPV